MSGLTERRPGLTQLAFFAFGALLMLSFAPVGWYPLAPFLLLPLLASCLFSTPRVAARHGFWFGAGLFLTGTYWLYISIHVFGDAPLAIALFLMLGLVIIMGFYYAATAWLITFLSCGNVWRFLWLAPAGWVFVEWLRGWFLSGFPWMTVGYGQIDSPLAGFAPVLGVYGVSAILLLSASALCAALVTGNRTRIVMLAIGILPWLAGGLLRQVEWTEGAGAPVRATVVQGGIAQDQKWLREQFEPTLDMYREATIAAGDSDLVVWPEVAIPAVIDQVESYIRVLEEDLANSGRSLLFGILDRDANSDGVFNSVVLLDGESRQVYRKRHLVPFGEFFPVPDFVREWMRLMSLPHSDINRGEPRQALLKSAQGQQLAVAICYEDAYGAEQLYALPDAGILVNVSNDAWFGDSIAPFQHLEIARMRALEVGRPAVRATNTGVSGFIAADGELLETGPQFEFVSMTREITPRTGRTPYVVAGNWPVIAVLSLLLAGFVWRKVRAGRA